MGAAGARQHLFGGGLLPALPLVHPPTDPPSHAPIHPPCFTPACPQGEEAEEGQKSRGTAELLKDQLSDDEEEYQVGG